jgi:hypothetical protein
MASSKIVAISLSKRRGQIRPLENLLRRLEPSRRMVEPDRVSLVIVPVLRGARDGVHHAQQAGIFGQPSLQQAPLP